MLGEQTLFPVLRLWFVLILVIATFSNRKLAAAISEHAGRKLATDIPGFISIDCGATEEYRDEETGIWYKTDAGFIDTGKNMPIFHHSTSANLSQQLMNIRIFPEGRKNCYTLKPESGKDKKYLIRAFFKYGNYDGNNRAPIFDLYLGVNKWDKVNLTVSISYLYSEIMHVPSTDTIDVCLLNIGSGVPLISALELRLLDSSLYQIDAGTLNVWCRYDIGMSKYDDIIRYPDDVYDRIWYYQNFSDWFSFNTTSPIDNQSNDGNYLIPYKVLRTAAQSAKTTMSMKYPWFSRNDSQFYVYLHFAEIEELENGTQREISVSSNNILVGSLRLEYLKPVSFKLLISGNQPEFTLNGSGLPPILNAFEIFVVRAILPNSPTDINDVNAIMDIKQKYKVNKVWQGDPCVPSEYQWDGLTCSDDNPPRIISLNLSSSKLKGEIADSLFNLTAIQTLDISFNDLTGPLPEFLAQLPDLKILNLTGNKLTGSVPEALSEKSANGLLLSLDKNPDLCMSNSCEGKKKMKKFVIPIVVCIMVLLLSLIALAICWNCKRKTHREMVVESKKEEPLKGKNRSFAYSEIVSITENFRTVIGEGGFGKVFLGTLEDDTKVAVKMLSQSSKQGYKEFRAETQLLMIVHHKNLVHLIGYCDDHNNVALIYEYMAGGNLRHHLSETNTKVLNWSERLQIAIDSAHGLEYLHNGCKPPIIHRDLKPANILLNEKMQAKIADFGLSRVFTNESGSHITTCPAGTIGYLDPEIRISGNINKKSDIYSFGIILFELITGQPAVIRDNDDGVHILQWVSPIIERGDIRNIIDPRLQGDFNINSAWKAVEIAMSCVPPTAIQRPDMSHVLAELKECLAIQMTRSSKRQSSNSLEMSSPDAR